MKRLLAFLLSLGLCATAVVPALAQSSSQDDQLEVQIGNQEYQQLKNKGEILSSSPYYAILNPIAQSIARVADQQYFRPFHFILVHETQPNAFAVPGGNVYVTDSLMKFVQNKEELAGVLCHETSHDIHHDVLNLYKKEQNVARNYTIGEVFANILTGGRAAGVINNVANISFNLQSLRFSRGVEGNADHKGAETCAQAGWNPWGMVWLFRHFESIDRSNPPEFLSDHPTDQARIAALQQEFAANPQLFGRFSSNIATATPLASPSSSSRGSRKVSTAAYRHRNQPFGPGSGYKF
jgi:predicted Zn-dependent protease